MKCSYSEYKPYVFLVQIKARKLSYKDKKDGGYIVKFPNSTLCGMTKQEFEGKVLTFGMSTPELLKNKRTIFKGKAFWQYNEADEHYRYFKNGRFMTAITREGNQWKVHEYVVPTEKLSRVTGKSQLFDSLDHAMSFVEGI